MEFMSELVKNSVFIKACEIHKLYFGLGSQYSRFVPTKGNLISPKVNCEIVRVVDIPTPLLEVGDKFYFEDTKEIVMIKEVMRTSENSVAYVIAYEYIIDEAARLQYEKDKKQYLDKISLKINVLEEKLKHYQNLCWWKLFFKRK
jgi:hypothetical protein